MEQSADPTVLPPPGPIAAAHSAELSAHIRAAIADNGGWLPFSRYMELALYTPGLGYYSAGATKFGAGGDFVTAPELSSLFGRCVAHQCRQVLEYLGGGVVLELGAGSGTMAADLLAELAALNCLPERYLILELSAELRQRQQATLAARLPQLMTRVTWLEQPPAALRGVIVGNEVVDAVPFERFRIEPAGAVPLGVAWDRGLRWQVGPVWTEFERQIAALQRYLDEALPVGYVSEINLGLVPWLATLAASLEQGVALFIDYGYPRREYYLPERRDGTMLCHYRHRAHADPFWYPGLQDITASVDFSALADAGRAAGLALAGYTNQSQFLIGCGLERLLGEADPTDSSRYLKLAREVKLLTLPGEMGERFQAMAFSRGMDLALAGCNGRDLRYRL